MNTHQYMCEFCDTSKAQEDKFVTLTLSREGRWYIFENVPARVCPNCGHRYYSGPMITHLEQLIRGRQLEGARLIEAYKIPFPSESNP